MRREKLVPRLAARCPTAPALLFAILLQLLPSQLAAQTPGQPLQEALRQLQAQGLDIFFTTRLVRPEMRVLQTPRTEDPRKRLLELLAPHGLTVVDGPGGRLVVALAPQQYVTLRGVVRVRHSETPVPGVRIFIPGTLHEVRSGQDGRFQLEDLPPGTYTLEAHLPSFVIARVEVTATLGQSTAVVVHLDPSPLALDEIIITPSQVSLLRKEPVSMVQLDQEDLLALPHLGDDVFRAFTLLPGVTSEETSARFNVRGGRTDEVLVLLDRVELFEPYHLKDFSSSQSIVAPRALGEVQLITGGFPAEYGDRMSGVLDMRTERTSGRRGYLGMGVLGAEAGGAGSFHDDKGHWLASFRRGFLDLAFDLLGQAENPRYWDAFAKAEVQLRPSQRLGVHLLHSDDKVDFTHREIEPGEDPTDETYITSYGNSYAWLTYQSIFSSRLFVDTVASVGRVDRDRVGTEVDPTPGGGEDEEDEEDVDPDDPEFERFGVFDARTLDVAGLKQDWSFQASKRNFMKWGFEGRQLVADYRYFNDRVLTDPVREIRSEPRTGTTAFNRELQGEQYSIYLSDRFRPADSLTMEVGLRFDRQTLTDDRNISPRVNLVYALPASTFRIAWGLFYQSQRPYELQVEDGVTELSQAERTEQRVLGFEHTFRRPGRSDLLFRIEAYQRLVSDPRLRFENLFEPVSAFPEIEPDRFRVAPQQSHAHGIELFLRGRIGRQIGWWASYSYSRVEDRIDGRDVPRRFDQPHAVSLDFDFPIGRHWHLNTAWRYHTGWPTTRITGRLQEEDGELEPVPVFGPINGERLPTYHRLDLRASRQWNVGRGTLGFFLEIQNLYNRENIAGFDLDFEFAVRPDGEVDVISNEREVWGGFLPSFGITWEF